MNGFDDFFQRLTGYPRHEWQARLAVDDICRDRLIRIPTGFGKTAGVAIAWLWNRVHQKNDSWPRRLVLCLPMRTLVEQTERAVSEWLLRAGGNPKEQIHVLLGLAQKQVLILARISVIIEPPLARGRQRRWLRKHQ